MVFGVWWFAFRLVSLVCLFGCFAVFSLGCVYVAFCFVLLRVLAGCVDLTCGGFDWVFVVFLGVLVCLCLYC